MPSYSYSDFEWGSSSSIYGPDGAQPEYAFWSFSAQFISTSVFGGDSKIYWDDYKFNNEWAKTSQVWRLEFTNGQNAWTAAGIPEGSKITSLRIGGNVDFTSGLSAIVHAKLSTSFSFNPVWNDQTDHNIRTHTAPAYSHNMLYSDLTSWNAPNNIIEDFLKGEGQAGLFVWFEHPDPTGGLTYNPYQVDSKKFRIQNVTWKEPSLDSGILLGNI